MTGALRRVCVVTGSRADYGLLRPVMAAIAAHSSLELQVAVTGAHLAAVHGDTVEEVRADGFGIDAPVPVDLSHDDEVSITRALGSAVHGFAGALDNLTPDLLLVLGDRYEVLAAVQAALIARVPVAHIAGGDVTVGAFDDAIRHAITKLAHLHFCTNDQSAARVRQLGEADERVFVTGSPGVDALLETPRMPRDAVERRVGMRFRPRNLLVTFHPATLDEADSVVQLGELLTALHELGSEFGIIFTGSNADPRGKAINETVETFVASRDNAVFHSSLGQAGYYSLLAQVDAVVGNSSSGLYEAPSFAIPTVNIGDRQQGRIKADSVIDCASRHDAIASSIQSALTLDCSQVRNPYGDGKAVPRIIEVLARPWSRAELVRKTFVDRIS
jgi:UDP-hydrolysing UDP-N-acetyl-D-glucosamine 2-epimerase